MVIVASFVFGTSEPPSPPRRSAMWFAVLVWRLIKSGCSFLASAEWSSRICVFYCGERWVIVVGRPRASGQSRARNPAFASLCGNSSEDTAQ
jgi:hypothetical protein